MRSKHVFVVTLGWATALAGVCTARGADREPVPASECPSTGEETASVAAIEPGLIIRLLDGRRLRLAGLDPPLPTPSDPDLDSRGRQLFETLIPDRRLEMSLMSLRPDRWGRLPAIVFTTKAPRSADPGGLTATALGLGLGRYNPEPDAHACRTAFLQAEESARQARLGLWRDPYYSILRVNDQAAFTERSATNVVVQGELRDVEPGPFRTKLRFVARETSHGAHTLVATIVPRVMRSFERDRIDLEKLEGRTLRFRGLLDLRFGPQIELTGPDALEIVPEIKTPPGPR